MKSIVVCLISLSCVSCKWVLVDSDPVSAGKRKDEQNDSATNSWTQRSVDTASTTRYKSKIMKDDELQKNTHDPFHNDIVRSKQEERKRLMSPKDSLDTLLAFADGTTLQDTKDDPIPSSTETPLRGASSQASTASSDSGTTQKPVTTYILTDTTTSASTAASTSRIDSTRTSSISTIEPVTSTVELVNSTVDVTTNVEVTHSSTKFRNVTTKSGSFPTDATSTQYMSTSTDSSSDTTTTLATPSESAIVVNDDHLATDSLWMFLSAFIIFTTQTGFALREAGLISGKNAANSMIRITSGVALSAFSFWLVGYGFAFGKSDHNNIAERFSGDYRFAWSAVDIETSSFTYTAFFFRLSFATASTSIAAGALGGRIKMVPFLIFSLLITCIIYPFPAHWIWTNEGWLRHIGAYDYAGALALHTMAGAAAFAASLILGPRLFKYGSIRTANAMNSPVNTVLGTLLLWWGWFGLTCGPTLGMSLGKWKLASRVAVVTMNGAVGGALATIIANIVSKPSTGYVLNIPQVTTGILGGLVSISGAASVIHTWDALVIGIIGGFSALAGNAIFGFFHVDDPVGCIGIHWAAGLWGSLAVGFFGKIEPFENTLAENGLFHGGTGALIWANAGGCLVISAWSAGLTAIVFLLMKCTIGIRLDAEDETMGADVSEHGLADDAGLAIEPLGRRVKLAEQDQESGSNSVTSDKRPLLR